MMSKFIDRLNKIAKGEITPIGFRRIESESLKKKIQLVISRPLAETGETAGVDGVIFDISGKVDAAALKNIPDAVPWGVSMKSGGQKDVKKLIDAGCDFFVFPPDAPVTMINDEKAGKILEADTSVSDSLYRTLVDLPVDAILISLPVNKTITWQDLMLVKKYGAIPGKPLFVRTAAKLTSAEIEALWYAGVNALVIEENVNECRNEIDKADFTKKIKREKNSPVVQQVQNVEVDEMDEEEEEDE